VQSSQGANGYAYVWNNPLSRWDPTGYGGTHENFAVWANSGRWERRIVNGQEEFVLTDRQSYWELTSSLIAHEFRLALIGSGASGSGGELGGSGSGGRGAGAPEGSKEEEPQSDPCNGLAGAVQEFTGGDNGLGWGEWWDSTASNYSDTIDFNVMSIGDYGVGLDTPIAMGAAPFVAQTWGGVTPGQALSQIVAAARATIQTPGLIGFRTPLQLTATVGASWLWNAAVAKGSYRVGVGAGSGLRAGVNQLVTYACSKQD